MLTRTLAFTFALAFTFFFFNQSDAQQPAFPGAEGAGMYTTGGRGTPSVPTTVFEVTNLTDVNSPGSLRYACSQSTSTYPYRTIVFRVSGTIHLASRLNIPANTTVAGQTAPGDGICLADYPVVINGDNVVVRYIRCRMGDKNTLKTSPSGCGVPVAPFTSSCMPLDGSGGDDALGDLGHKNIIIDHCSVSWSSDEALTVYRGDNVTMQWNFIEEPLNYSYHFETGDTDFEHHGYGGIWGSKHGSFHHNLIAHCRNRNPRFSGISTYSPSTVGIENCDLRNNVIFDWGINTVYGGEGGNYKVVNNYYKYGPNTSSGVKYRVCNPGFSATVAYGKWYVNGNYVDGSTINTANNWKGVNPQGGDADTSIVKASTPFDLGYPVTTQSPVEAYEAVLLNGGCSLPNRDTLDQRIVNDVRNRTGRFIDVQGGYAHGTPYASTVNAWPALNSTAAPADSDHDGMPDTWETANGLNPNDASDRNGYNANGYTNLENYLNSLTNPVVNTNPTIYATPGYNNFAQTIGSPSTAQTFSVSGTNLTGDITVTAPANYQLSLDGTNWNTSLTLPLVSGTVAYTTINIRLNASTPGSYNGNIAATSAGATTVNLDVAGVAINASPVPANQKQVIGVFPAMEGGFENQPAGALSTGVPTGANTPPAVWTTNGSANIMSDGAARTGSNYFTYTSTSASTKNNYSPAVTSPLFANGTKYIVQFFYRATSMAAGNQVGGLLATTDNSGTTNFTTAYATSTYSATGGAWQKATYAYSINPSYTTNTVFGGFRFNGGGSAIAKPFDVDDFVVYPADNQASPAADVAAPDAATSPTASATGNSIAVSWNAPATGVDGGGYIVVRSTSPTPPTLTANGLYSIGNVPGAGSVVVFLGASPSFVDNGSVAALASGTTYYYHIFTADKAFNYSSAVTVSGALAVPLVLTTGSLAAFTQNIGAPSPSQYFTVSGNNLTGNVTVSAPAGFEVSLDDNSWTSSLEIAPVNGTADPSTVFVRLNASTANTYSGNIMVNSNGTTTVTIPVNGVVSGTLPVTFISAKAYAKGSGVQVEWKTAAESGLQAYVVERSTSGAVFNEVASFRPANNNSGGTYAWFDAAPFSGDNFYRIKVVENGYKKYTNILKVNTGKKTSELVIASNPVRGGLLNLQLNGLQKGMYSLRLYNAVGQQTFSKALSVEGSSFNEIISLPSLPAGIYAVQLTNDGINLTQKISIQ